MVIQARTGPNRGKIYSLAGVRLSAMEGLYPPKKSPEKPLRGGGRSRGGSGSVNELSIRRFQLAIFSAHECRSHLRERVFVREKFEGETVWEGEVLVFDLTGHPTAVTCYAWSVDQRVTAVLAEGPIDSPQAAVRAAIVSEESDG